MREPTGTRAEELRRTIRQLTEVRDAAIADGQRQVAEDAIDAAYAVMEELRRLTARTNG